MQLSEILTENSIKSIHEKTKISEENLENLFAKKFENLIQVKTLGFLSIIEREYKVDLSAEREEALAYYESNYTNVSVTLGSSIVDEKKGTSKLFLLMIFLLLGYATWYFLTQYDQKHLSQLIPFMEDEKKENLMIEENQEASIIAEDLSIVNAIKNKVSDKIIVSETEIDHNDSFTEVNNTDK
jgi:hypothetical protein